VAAACTKAGDVAIAELGLVSWRAGGVDEAGQAWGSSRNIIIANSKHELVF
jgi:hypothetical protein